MNARLQKQKGFTLVEMIVAVGLFAVVMVICVMALLSLVSANKKAQALQSVMNNLNVAVDGMVRSVRMGTLYHCGQTGTYSTPLNCSGGDSFIAYKPFQEVGVTKPTVLYWFQNDTINGKTVGRLYRSVDGTVAGGAAVTAPEVSIDIDRSRFYIFGACPAHVLSGCTPDQVQPKLLVVIQGSAGSAKATVISTFHIQATAVQRVLDI